MGKSEKIKIACCIGSVILIAVAIGAVCYIMRDPKSSQPSNGNSSANESSTTISNPLSNVTTPVPANKTDGPLDHTEKPEPSNGNSSANESSTTISNPLSNVTTPVPANKTDGPLDHTEKTEPSNGNSSANENSTTISNSFSNVTTPVPANKTDGPLDHTEKPEQSGNTGYLTVSNVTTSVSKSNNQSSIGNDSIVKSVDLTSSTTTLTTNPATSEKEKIYFEKYSYIVNDFYYPSYEGDIVTTVKAISKYNVSYIITSPNTNNIFKIDNKTGEILNNFSLLPLDEKYNLTVTAYDDEKNNATTNVQIFTKKAPSSVTVKVGENYSCIQQLKWNKNKYNVIFKIDDEIKDKIFTIDDSGCLMLIQPLDKKPEVVKLTGDLYFNRTFSSGQNIPDSIEVIVIIPNENKPYLDNQIIDINEKEQPQKIISLNATDSQSPGPFNYTIDNFEADSLINNKFEIKGDELWSKVTFNYTEQAEYKIPINITDTIDPTKIGKSYFYVLINKIEDDE